MKALFVSTVKKTVLLTNLICGFRRHGFRGDKIEYQRLQKTVSEEGEVPFVFREFRCVLHEGKVQTEKECRKNDLFYTHFGLCAGRLLQMY